MELAIRQGVVQAAAVRTEHPDLDVVTRVDRVQRVHCPNCGSHAERHHLMSDRLLRTQCPSCDYLMITCADSGRVIEAYAPGIFAR